MATHIQTPTNVLEEHGEGVIIHWTMARATGKVLCATVHQRKPYTSPKYVQRTKTEKRSTHNG